MVFAHVSTIISKDDLSPRALPWVSLLTPLNAALRGAHSENFPSHSRPKCRSVRLIEINDISNVEGKLTVLVAYIGQFFADLRYIAYLNKAPGTAVSAPFSLARKRRSVGSTAHCRIQSCYQQF